jgi:phage virion morphogenesis protein
MSDGLRQVEDWAGALLARFSPAERKRLAMDIARALRKSQSARIADQLAPDGSPYPSRKRRVRDKRGRLKRKKMFLRLKTARYFKISAAQGLAEVGFQGRAGRIAGVHQHGEMDKVAPDGPRVRYPRRPLLGFTDRDRLMVRDQLIDRLTK